MTVTRTVQEAFVARAARAARATAKEYGVPAPVTLAQAALESDWGRAHMGEANNYFGIKAYDKGEPTEDVAMATLLGARDRQAMVVLGDPTVALPPLPSLQGRTS